MCTVTYLPNVSGFILTSNRDVHISRKQSRLPREKLGLLYPEDGEAGGTWIAASRTGRILCLLNGAFERHIRKKSYRKSRGIIVLELFDIGDVGAFKDKFSLRGIEPFTLIWIETQPRVTMHEIRWDGKNKHIKKLKADENHIWSSATLYDPAVRALRENWFDAFLATAESEIDAYDMLDFHKSAGDGIPEHNVMMKRPDGVQTVSTSQIQYDGEKFQFLHQNYITTKASITDLSIEMN